MWDVKNSSFEGHHRASTPFRRRLWKPQRQCEFDQTTRGAKWTNEVAVRGALIEARPRGSAEEGGV